MVVLVLLFVEVVGAFKGLRGNIRETGWRGMRGLIGDYTKGSTVESHIKDLKIYLS